LTRCGCFTCARIAGRDCSSRRHQSTLRLPNGRAPRSSLKWSAVASLLILILPPPDPRPAHPTTLAHSLTRPVDRLIQRARGRTREPVGSAGAAVRILRMLPRGLPCTHIHSHAACRHRLLVQLVSRCLLAREALRMEGRESSFAGRECGRRRGRQGLDLSNKRLSHY
jgi:hypothetical protein